MRARIYLCETGYVLREGECACVDIDIDDVDDSQSIYYVVVVIVNHSLLQAILFVSKW